MKRRVQIIRLALAKGEPILSAIYQADRDAEEAAKKVKPPKPAPSKYRWLAAWGLPLMFFVIGFLLAAVLPLAVRRPFDPPVLILVELFPISFCIMRQGQNVSRMGQSGRNRLERLCFVGLESRPARHATC